MSLYFDSLAVPGLPNVENVGCFIDNNNRVLPYAAFNNASNTQTLCSTACTNLGHVYSGTEAANECWCGDKLPTTQTDNSLCTRPCPGGLDPQRCGGAGGTWAINVMKNTQLTPPSSSLPAGVNALGCYQDNWVRALPFQAYNNASNTPALCVAACTSDGYAYSGVEHGECWCGSTINPSLALANSTCTESCPGNNAQTCGGSYLLNVAQNMNVLPAPLPTGWSSLGCFSDSYTRTIQTQLWSASNNTNTACLTACTKAGYSFAGTESSQECYCSSSAPASNLVEPSTDCGTPCPADGTQICGGRWRLSAFKYSA
jgi:hypothetical protein